MTESLSEFIKAQEEDSNHFWRLSSGDHLNLLEEAVERLERIQAATANHPAPCEKYPDGDVVTCGWKSAYRDVVRALEAGE